jgi:hypothetical protein
MPCTGFLPNRHGSKTRHDLRWWFLGGRQQSPSPGTRRPSQRDPQVPGRRWASVPWLVTQICSITGFSDAIEGSGHHYPGRTLAPDSKEDRVRRVGYTDHDPVCKIYSVPCMRICGLLCRTKRLSRSTSRFVPHREGSRYVRISYVISGNMHLQRLLLHR